MVFLYKSFVLITLLCGALSTPQREFLLTSVSTHYTSQRALSTHLRGLFYKLQNSYLFRYVRLPSHSKKSTDKPYKSPLHLSEVLPYIHQRDLHTHKKTCFNNPENISYTSQTHSPTHLSNPTLLTSRSFLHT